MAPTGDTMTPPTPTTVRVQRVDVPLHAGRILRVDLTRAHDGSPELLRLAEGWAGGGHTDRHREVAVPGSALSALRDALDALLADLDRVT